MKYVTSYTKKTTCERCGRGISNVVVFLNEEDVCVELGVDCAAKVMNTKQNVLSRWISKQDDKIRVAKNQLGREGLCVEITQKRNVRFWPKNESKEFFSFYYPLDFIKIHFPEVVKKFSL